MAPRRTATITAVGKYLPEGIITNFDLEKMMDTNDEWIRSRTGIVERHVVKKGEASAAMSTVVALQICKQRNIEPSEIDCIIVGTVTPDMLFPATACLVQKNIGANRAWGFDLSAACSGFLFGLDTGACLIESGRYNKVLVIGVDTMSAILDYTDRTTAILFGDGAGGVLLEPDETGESGIMDSVLRCDGNGADALYMTAGGSLNPATIETVENMEHYIRQDGKTVFKQAVKWMADATSEIAKRNNLTNENIKLFIPHQANKRIIDACADRLKLKPEQVLINIEKYANTTAGTIPLGIADAVEDKRLKPGDNVIISAFGAGFTWGATYIKWGQIG